MEDKLFNFQYDWHLSTSAQKLMKTRRRKPDMLTSHTTWPQKKKFSLTPQLKFHVYTNFEVELWWWFCTTNWICIQLEREVGKETEKWVICFVLHFVCITSSIIFFCVCVDSMQLLYQLSSSCLLFKLSCPPS